MQEGNKKRFGEKSLVSLESRSQLTCWYQTISPWTPMADRLGPRHARYGPPIAMRSANAMRRPASNGRPPSQPTMQPKRPLPAARNARCTRAARCKATPAIQPTNVPSRFFQPLDTILSTKPLVSLPESLPHLRRYAALEQLCLRN